MQTLVELWQLLPWLLWHFEPLIQPFVSLCIRLLPVLAVLWLLYHWWK